MEFKDEAAMYAYNPFQSPFQSQDDRSRIQALFSDSLLTSGAVADAISENLWEF